jgi:hypothetical protein
MFIARLIILSSSVYSLTLTKTSFEKIYKDEVNVNTKERIILVLNGVYQGKISAAHVAIDIHRNRAWARV